MLRFQPKPVLLFGIVAFLTAMIAFSVLPWDNPPVILPARFRNDLPWLIQTHAGIANAYRQADVTVSFEDGHALGVAFINSAFNAISSPDEQTRRAHEVAALAKRCCPRLDRIDTIHVSFVSEWRFLIFYARRSVDFHFDKSEFER